MPEETCCYELTKAYDYEDPRDLSPEALAYRSMQDLLARYDADLTAPDGYFSKLGLDDVTPDSVVMTIPTGYDYIQYEDGKAIGYTYIQSPVTAFICDSFNYTYGGAGTLTPEICATAITFLTGRSPVMFPASKSISRRATAGSLWTSTKPTPPRSPLNPPRTW